MTRQLSPDQLSRGVAAIGATVICYTLLAASCKPAYAEEREWKPRRHHRRLGERWTNNWARELVEEQERDKEQQLTARKRQERLLREQEEAEAAQRRAEEAARRKRAEAILAEQAKEGRTSSSALPFSVKVGGTDVAPLIIWGALGLLAAGALKGTIQRVSNSRRRRAEGKYVYDRSLGGKKVWVPAEGTTPAAEQRPKLSDRDLDKLTSLAAAAATAPKKAPPKPAPGPFVMPQWWAPQVRLDVAPALKEARQADVERIIGRMEAGRNAGYDFSLDDILRLREICQEGNLVAQPRTVGSRDALYRTAVEAAVEVALDPPHFPKRSPAMAAIHNAPPTRFLASLAADINLPADKAVPMVTAAVAKAVRARLLEALAGIKEAGPEEDGEIAALTALMRLTSLLTKLPVLSLDSTEVSLIADSLQGSFSVDERRRVFYLMGQLHPEGAALSATLLGFDPAAVVPQLQSDMEKYLAE